MRGSYILPTLLLCLIACSPKQTPEARLAGTWKGQIDMPGMPEALSAKGNDLRAVTLLIAPDRTFSMTMMIITLKGTWALSGRELTLTPGEGSELPGLKVGGKGIGSAGAPQSPLQTTEKPMILQASEDFGKLMLTGEAAQALGAWELEKAK